MYDGLVARVVIEQTVYHIDRLYDYIVPESLVQEIKPGMRVLVPFGKGDRKRQGFVIDLKDGSDCARLKSVTSVIDKEPIINDEMQRLVLWLKDRTFCTYFDAVRTLLPAGISLKTTLSYRINPDYFETLKGDEAAVFEFLTQNGGFVERDKILKSLGFKTDSPILEKMYRKGMLTMDDVLKRKVSDAYQRSVRLLGCGEDIKLTPKQKSVVDFLENVKSAGIKELCYFTGVGESVIKTLEKKGIVEFFDVEVFRKPYNVTEAQKTEIELTKSQNEAFLGLLEKYKQEKHETALLYGVTGSGKTQVFLKLADEAVREKRGVIVMVPEISLTPQTIAAFHKRYGDKVAVFHSAMSLGQRMDEWKRIKNGDALIAVGTRSAVFAPFDDVGLIIIDEEQEHTYKSEQSPRFHARDVARFRGAYHNSLVLLCSATPSIESFANAKSGKYSLFKLSQRYGNAHLPQVKTVDMRVETARGNKGLLSSEMVGEISATLSDGHQVILLLNRRGHNTFVSCPACGHVATCPNCSISMTYHSANNRLICHYCGHSDEYMKKCPECDGEHIRYSGVGTQKAEEEISLLFPKAKVLRLDADSTMTRMSFENKLGAFSRGEYDILLGTQMVAKGLDFPNVTLVGVLNADQSMYSDNYRSFERTFSLLTQVIGRSGRGEKAGKAIIQTINPDSKLIKTAAAQDYESFYEDEIMSRRLMIFPPFCELALIGVIADSKEVAKASAEAVFQIMREKIENEYKDVKLIILGPSISAVPRVNNKYRYRIFVKYKSAAKFRKMLDEVLLDWNKSPLALKSSVFVDPNPEGVI